MTFVPTEERRARPWGSPRSLKSGPCRAAPSPPRTRTQAAAAAPAPGPPAPEPAGEPQRRRPPAPLPTCPRLCPGGCPGGPCTSDYRSRGPCPPQGLMTTPPAGDLSRPGRACPQLRPPAQLALCPAAARSPGRAALGPGSQCCPQSCCPADPRRPEAAWPTLLSWHHGWTAAPASGSSAGPLATGPTWWEGEAADRLSVSAQSSRIDDQRCPPPDGVPRGPTVPDEDFFSLIQRVQAKRMDEQRVDLAGSPEQEVGGPPEPRPQCQPGNS